MSCHTPPPFPLHHNHAVLQLMDFDNLLIKDDEQFFLDMQTSQVFVGQTSAHNWTRLQIVLPMINF